MGEENLRKGYETPVMPARPTHEGFIPATMPYIPVDLTPPPAQIQTPVTPVQNKE